MICRSGIRPWILICARSRSTRRPSRFGTFGQKLSDSLSDGWTASPAACRMSFWVWPPALPALILLAVIVIVVIVLVKNARKKRRAKFAATEPPQGRTDKKNPKRGTPRYKFWWGRGGGIRTRYHAMRRVEIAGVPWVRRHRAPCRYMPSAAGASHLDRRRRYAAWPRDYCRPCR